jgi:phosphatidylglycerol:prolipoprotein diacylglycerol transferase
MTSWAVSAHLAGLLGAISYDPIVRIHLGPLSLSPHGIGVATGFLVGIYGFFLPGMRRAQISEDDAYALVLRVMVGALVGSRLFYVLNHLSDFPNPVSWLKLWEGGFTLIGGITGATSLAFWYTRKKGIPFFSVSDPAMPGLAAGLIIGRIGDLVIADHLGKPTDFVLGYKCPTPAIVGVTVGSPCPPGQVVHSTALYDLVVVVGLLFLLLFLRRHQHYPGFLTMVYGAVYGAARLVEDFLRADKTIAGLTGSQWAGLTVMLYCLYVLAIKRSSPSWGLKTKAAYASPLGTENDGTEEASDVWVEETEVESSQREASQGDQPHSSSSVDTRE